MICEDCHKPLGDYPYSRAYTCSECLSTLCFDCHEAHEQNAHSSDLSTAAELASAQMIA
jgi:hypothetical protein